MPEPAVRQAARDLACALDPALFAERKLGFAPDPWQVDFLRTGSPRILLNITRQGGKSTTAALLALHTALFRPKSLILLVSPSLRQSGELFKKVGQFRAALDPAAPLSVDNSLGCTFAGSGSRIVSLPGDGDTVRGFSAPDLIIEDEAARVDDTLYRSVRPMLATNDGRLILMSTPNGQAGHFWAEWSAGGGTWERIAVKAEQVTRIPATFLAEERRSLGDTWYRTEYCCEFLQATNQTFRPEDVARMISAEVQPLFPTAPVAGDPLPLFPRGLPPAGGLPS